MTATGSIMAIAATLERGFVRDGSNEPNYHAAFAVHGVSLVPDPRPDQSRCRAAIDCIHDIATYVTKPAVSSSIACADGRSHPELVAKQDCGRQRLTAYHPIAHAKPTETTT